MSLPRHIIAWQLDAADQPLLRKELPVPEPTAGQVLVEVAGCGLCHTDLSFLFGGVRAWKRSDGASSPGPRGSRASRSRTCNR